jgi:acyl-CoA synthetase (AMP-forming)/AMP-acid ligase II
MKRAPAITAAPVLDRIGDYVAHHAALAPEREALVAGARRISYAQLHEQVQACARALLQAGISKGDRVAMLGAPAPEFFIVFLASTQIGAVWVGLNPKYQYDELLYVINDAQPKVLLAPARIGRRDYLGDLQRLQQACPAIGTLVLFGEQPATGAMLHADFIAAGQSTPATAVDRAAQAVKPLDAALIVYTSGSSGSPKGAMLSHRGLCFGNAIQGREFGVALPRAVCPFPINHIACVGDTCCTTLIRGGSLVFMEQFDARAVLRCIDAERINLWIGVPTMFILALRELDALQPDLSSLETIVWGGAAMPPEAIRQLALLGARMVTLYGLTESTTDMSFTPPEATLQALAETVGRPAPEFPCRVVADDGRLCAPGEAGEIQFKGDFVMLGYHGRPQATREAFTADGWLRSGDLGSLDAEGQLRFIARRSEMFKSGGYNVYPREIEAVLEQLPGVALAAVIGVPDPLYQEVGEAHVLCAAGPRWTRPRWRPSAGCAWPTTRSPSASTSAPSCRCCRSARSTSSPCAGSPQRRWRARTHEGRLALALCAGP